MTEPEEPFGPAARPDRAMRGRRLGFALAAQLRALLVPDRGVPPLVSAGRARLSIAIAIVAALLAAAAISARIDMAPTVRAENAGGPPPGAGPGPADPAAEPGEDKTDRDIQEEIDKRTAIVQVKAWLRASLGMPAQIFAFAIILLLLGRYVGGKPTFQRAAAAAAVANLPWAVHALIVAAAAWSQDRIGPSDIDQLVLGNLLPLVQGNPLFVPLAAAANLFGLWSLLLAGFGLATAAGISRRRSFIAVTVTYLLLYFLIVSLLMSPGAA